MSFAGLRNAQDRINLIAFLRTNADSPAAIPAPAPKKEEAPAAAPAGPADATKPAAEAPAAGTGKPLPDTTPEKK